MQIKEILTLLENWDETHVLTKEEALAILELPEEAEETLIAAAGKLRTKYKGKKVSVQLLTNVRSGNCSQNCAYCAQSCESHAAIEKYRRVSDEKLYGDNDLVDDKHLARHCIGLSGIRFTDAEIEDLACRIRKMKKNGTQICCSIGFLTEKQALMLKEAGLNRINHNLNSSRSFYPNICLHHFGLLCENADRYLNDKQKAEFYPEIFALMERNLQRLEEDVSWLIDKFDYRNKDADWKTSKDALQRGMQKLRGGYPADPPFKQK